jgi:hypothetical protein
MGKMYKTFIATGMTMGEMSKFLDDFSKLECTSWTVTKITFSETSPRTATIAIHVEEEQDFLLSMSFDGGQLHHWGHDKRFILQPELLTAKDVGLVYKEPRTPEEAH